MGRFHFEEHSYSDTTVVATMSAPEAVDSYHFEHKTYPNIYIRNRGLAHHLSFLADDSDEIKALRETVEEYNEYLAKLEAIPGFVEYFKQHGFCVSREEITDKWSEEIADLVFSKKSYCFDTELSIIHDCLLDSSFSVTYQANVENCLVSIPIGKPDTAYPDMINGKKAIWNWVDNGHDFCLKLWMLLGERESQNDESIEDDTAVHYDFDAYDQFRHDYVEPQLVNVFKKLESLGYIESHTIKPEHEDPRWFNYGKTDESIDLALIDTSFLKNSLIMEQIELLLWQQENDIQEGYEYFKPFGYIDTTIGNSRLGEVFVKDRDNKLLLKLQGRKGTKLLKVTILDSKAAHSQSQKVVEEKVRCQITKYQMCMGCLACESICRHGAITIVADKQGLVSYRILDNKCVRCGECITHYDGGCYMRRVMCIKRT